MSPRFGLRENATGKKLSLVKADVTTIFNGDGKVTYDKASGKLKLHIIGENNYIGIIQNKRQVIEAGQAITIYVGDTLFNPLRQYTSKVQIIQMEGSSLDGTPDVDQEAPTVVPSTKKRRRIIIESDSETDEEKMDDDDVFNQLKSEDAIHNCETRCANVISILDESEDDDEKKDQIISIRSDDDDDDDDDDNSGAGDYHVSEAQQAEQKIQQAIETCKSLSIALERSIGGSSSSTHLSLSRLSDENENNSHKSSSIIRQSDIPNLSRSLVLKDYQVIGINWLYLLNQHRLSGVLADDMGLGKTVQTIAFLALVMARETTPRPNLIIVPASVLSNWSREIQKFAPSLRVAVYYGNEKERQVLQQTYGRASDFDILLTTYSYFQRENQARDRSFLRHFRFNYMVLDEGHSIKNANSAKFRHLTRIRTEFRLILSGTPIQNNIEELISLLSFLMPQVFGHKDEMATYFEDHRHEGEKLGEIRTLLSPFILRRIKTDVLTQLPDKTIVVKVISNPPEQVQVYQDLLAYAREKQLAVSHRKTQDRQHAKSSFNRQLRLLQPRHEPPMSKKTPDSGATSFNSSSIFCDLRKACNHPMLLRRYFTREKLEALAPLLYRAGEFGFECTVARVLEELEGYSDFSLHELCEKYSSCSRAIAAFALPRDVVMRSGKFDFLKRELPRLYAQGRRVLIFSQWTSILDLLETFLDTTSSDYRYLRLDGGTKVSERQALIDAYTEDSTYFIFLLSTRAGGLGINLTAADTVILHDLDFNPTIDDQAIDRVHRIGQTKRVEILKLVSKDTVDERIFAIGTNKQLVNEQVLGETKSTAAQQKKMEKSMIESILESVLLQESSGSS